MGLRVLGLVSRWLRSKKAHMYSPSVLIYLKIFTLSEVTVFFYHINSYIFSSILLYECSDCCIQCWVCVSSEVPGGLLSRWTEAGLGVDGWVCEGDGFHPPLWHRILGLPPLHYRTRRIPLHPPQTLPTIQGHWTQLNFHQHSLYGYFLTSIYLKCCKFEEKFTESENCCCLKNILKVFWVAMKELINSLGFELYNWLVFIPKKMYFLCNVVFCQMCRVMCATEPEMAFQFYIQHKIFSPVKERPCKGTTLEQLGSEFRTLKARNAQTLLKGNVSVYLVTSQFLECFSTAAHTVNVFEML